MGYQFIHMECYSRKSNKKGQSVGFVLDEASRVQGACKHVENPQPPVLVHGCDIDSVRRIHDEAVEGAISTNVKGQKSRIRVDQCTLATLVASHPGGTAEEVEFWQEKTLDWMKHKYGDDLVSVIRHDDESFPHLHAYVLPRHLRAREVHPGVVAKLAAEKNAKDSGLSQALGNKEGNNAYRKAMRDFQDSYWRAVGIPCGLARLGPGRRRLTRSEWQAEQAMVQKTAELQRLAVDAEKKIGAARVAARAAQDATKVAQQAQNLAATAMAELQVKTAEAVEAVESKHVEKVKEFESKGLKLRSLLTGWWSASPQVLAEQIVSSERDSWKTREKQLLQEQNKISRRVYELEKSVRELGERISKLVTENMNLRSRLTPNIRQRFTTPQSQHP